MLIAHLIYLIKMTAVETVSCPDHSLLVCLSACAVHQSYCKLLRMMPHIWYSLNAKRVHDTVFTKLSLTHLHFIHYLHYVGYSPIRTA